MSSIRGKIALSYYLLAGVAVGFALFAYGDLRYLEQRITEGGVVSAFREEVLEMLGIELGPVRLKCALLSLKVLKAGIYGLRSAEEGDLDANL